ncbi:hypothetical protein V1512DRAFT_277764 [Lipomyces arxii]|uniref:uncharacterized protein n=1 Tax=Lipomyces arxii TaxID=56418 RepID=UPI0034CFF0F9
MGFTAYLPSWLRRTEPVQTVNAADISAIINDKDLSAFYEANTPSRRREAVLKSSIAVGMSKETAEGLVARRNFVLKPLSRDERRKQIWRSAEHNCTDYQHVVQECIALKPDWRLGLNEEDIKKKEDLCLKAKDRVNICLETQVKLLYAMGHKMSHSNAALDQDLEWHALSLFMTYYGTPHHPHEPSPADLAKINEGSGPALDSISIL